MPTSDPADASFCNLFTRYVVKTDPLKMSEFSPELHNWPCHGDTWLSDNGPPMFLSFGLFFDAEIWPILAVIYKVWTVFLG
ncbi:hypothetical protein SynPROSU1_00638 [Synechococcus sp. PROS-U-1]|nr:hypothetical protein SynPROSU1_00638 [Synechococcus sp. PROS-U-1]